MASPLADHSLSDIIWDIARQNWRQFEKSKEHQNVLVMPYAVVPRKWIEKLIQIGLLDRSKAHDVEAVETALDTLQRRRHRE